MMLIATIHQDEDCESPREWDNLGTLCLFHRRYDLPNESGFSAEEVQAHVTDPEFKGVCLPVWAYDHGGAAFKAGERTHPFDDQWDSGQAGVIYIERAKIVEEFGGEKTDEQIAEYLKQEVEEYSAWSNGECYGYVLKDSDIGEEVESCWGFIGYDSAVEAAKEAGADAVQDN